MLADAARPRLMRRPVSVGSADVPGMLPDPAALSGVAGAWHRALPFTRLVDYGMDAADARELLWRTAEGDDWSTSAEGIGDRQLERAGCSRGATARGALRYAMAAFNVAQVVINFDDNEKRRLYDRLEAATADYAAARGDTFERVEVAHGDGLLTGWLALPSHRARGTVIVWGGLSGWGTAYLRYADALNERGLACLLAEGPGQGASRLRHRIYARERALDGYNAFVDWALSDQRLFSGGVGIQGNSFGGLMAARVLARDERVRAGIINGAPAVASVPEFRSAREQILSFVGCDDADEAARFLEALSFDPSRHLIEVPTLVLHGVRDPLVTHADIAPFLSAARHESSELVEWPDGQHTLYNHAEERDALSADWFSKHLR